MLIPFFFSLSLFSNREGEKEKKQTNKRKKE
jgi:hypothetical protein